jgi:hypothetical protein
VVHILQEYADVFPCEVPAGYHHSEVLSTRSTLFRVLLCRTCAVDLVDKGIGVDHAKVEAIDGWPILKNHSQV